MDPVTQIVLAACAALGGLLVGAVLGGKWRNGGAGSRAEAAAEAQAREIIRAAETQKAEIERAAQVEGKERLAKLRKDADDAAAARRRELDERAQELAVQGSLVEEGKRDSEKREAELKRRERTIQSRERAAEAMAEKAEVQRADADRTLERVASMTRAEAVEELTKSVSEAAQKEAAKELKAIEQEAEETASARSKEIIVTAIQRYASEFVAERTVAVVPLPSDDMKGRLIGREGRNIRALEANAGIDLIIDDTSEVITISCFNPVRREIGRMAITKLVSDGRIHPTRIEEVVRECQQEVEQVSKEAGEQAVFDLGLHRVHPELVLHLGRLKYRSSYAQNLLAHSIEVGFLAGLIASEVGISVRAARRAGLLHDIGKSVDHELEGSHAEVGAQLAKKHGEAPRVCRAIASHHGTPGPETVLDHIVDGANQLSAARPGARRELLASYVKRLEELETMAQSFAGVTRAYAVQMGREIRVMVENAKIDDSGARAMAKELAGRIEKEAAYPGQVRVVVVRESRASDYAR